MTMENLDMMENFDIMKNLDTIENFDTRKPCTQRKHFYKKENLDTTNTRKTWTRGKQNTKKNLVTQKTWTHSKT